MLRESVRTKLETLPSSPGVYVFKGAGDAVLYIGKARSLRSRVRSYFSSSNSDYRAFISRLERELVDLETFVTTSEKEAALLEQQLIKRHRPRYNVKLRDDKEFLSLRLDTRAEWPRLEVVRRPKNDRALYFGPYPSATAARTTLRLVNRYFQLRTCTDQEMKRRERPCLQYQIHRCPAPCVYEVDHERYLEQVKNVALFLSGRHDELRKSLEAKMAEAAAEMRYEDAAVSRDQLKALDAVREKQIVSSVKDRDQDVVGLYREDEEVEIALLMIRAGKLVHVVTFSFERSNTPAEELLGNFVLNHYSSGVEIPDEILLPLDIEASAGIAELLSEARGKRMRIVVPQRGSGTDLLALAHENAEHAFKEKGRKRQGREELLSGLKERLRLPSVPYAIECFDISHTAGKSTFAACVKMIDGELSPPDYRSFRIRTAAESDDYGALREALDRRFLRAQKDERWPLPDLLVIDGGKGQLALALAAAEAHGFGDLPIIAIAEEGVSSLGEAQPDRVYLPGQKNPIPIHAHPSLRLIALIRNEAHRFANKNRLDEGKRMTLRSSLRDIKGIGEKTERRLLMALGSFEEVRKASVAELIAAGANAKQANAIREAIGAADGSVEDAIENAFRH